MKRIDQITQHYIPGYGSLSTHCREHRKLHFHAFASKIVLSYSFANSLEVAVSWNKQQLVFEIFAVRISVLKVFSIC
jgi:hypothetical protein